MGLHLTQRTELLAARGRHFRQRPAALQQAIGRLTDGGHSASLDNLCALAMTLGGARSAGVSALLDGTDDVIIRCAAGELARTRGLVFPLGQSPCGICADTDMAQLFVHPHRHFLWMAEADIFVQEWLVTPVRAADGAILGTLWVTSGEDEPVQFDQTDLDTLQQIAARPAVTAALQAR